ncbi:MAG TPA: 3-deoxy-manno-octulosonate cytidylyltransferase, partial [Verrucomicrobiae bacterium]|nr:3-deoxy-manno-octulosonate cytidylyltransferase [Verrucomicrobiae bacterium]
MPAKDSTPCRVLAVIPARFASTRFPGKVLAPIAGQPMVQRVYERVRACRSVDRVVVATDSPRVIEAVGAFGGESVMTRADHASGTERMAEVAGRIAAEIYVNVQGDEPLMDPVAVAAGVECVASDPAVAVGTIAAPLRDKSELANPNVVKVVCATNGDALYFSRAPVPWLRDAAQAPLAESAYLKHAGLYVFRREALLRFAKLPPGRLEQIEQLEQLRLLENGIPIRVAITDYESVAVDVPAD